MNNKVKDYWMKFCILFQPIFLTSRFIINASKFRNASMFRQASKLHNISQFRKASAISIYHRLLHVFFILRSQ